MRKFLILGMIAAVVVMSSVAFADTGASATAALTLTSVINISVTDNWDNLEIAQSDIAGWGAREVLDWGELTVNVKAMTNFKVWSSYYAKEGGMDVSPAFGSTTNLLGVDDGTTLYWLIYNEITNPNAYAGPYSATVLTELFSGSNNVLAGGDTKTYTVKLNPSSLGDRTAGEVIDFTIVFVVEDPTT